MNPDDPIDDFGPRNTVALLLLAADALAAVIERWAEDAGEGSTRRLPDELDLALLGVVALDRRIRAAAGDAPTSTSAPARPADRRLLR